MSVQCATTGRFGEIKPTGIYLMELRRRFADLNPCRQRLVVASWGLPEMHQVPIQRRAERFSKAQA